MRKQHQKQILELLESIRQAQSAKMYSECQEAAESLITFIAGISDKGQKTVNLLAEYIELLFKAHIGEIREKLLKRHLIKIENSVKSELKPDKIEVVFFPYKASMWDSLESVYLTAKDDVQCDVYCVPIPYFDKNSDGSLGQMHYEGNEYPKDIEVIPWQAYNIEQRHPDIVFVHNPYDSNNLVTTVHPDYYNEKLHRCTDLLVYIDYGLPIWIFKNPTPYENIIPGWFHFDLFCTYSKEYARNQSFAMKKVMPELQTEIIALGSPKFDKVLNSKKEDFELPEKWEKIIAGRRAVLFNTTLGALLEDTEGYLDRLSNILDIFKDINDAALWWRPHPLILPTLLRMRPQQAKRYADIVERYRLQGWGIYDVSHDVHRAIAYTDAYYGDESSVVYLYCATGKPFTICGIPHQSYVFTENTEDFERTLKWRIQNMQTVKGANISNYNVCIWWGNFYEDLDYAKFLRLFLDYVVHTERYPDSEAYKNQQIRLFQDFVVNSDGTAGEKIYDYCKRKILGE